MRPRPPFGAAFFVRAARRRPRNENGDAETRPDASDRDAVVRDDPASAGSAGHLADLPAEPLVAFDPVSLDRLVEEVRLEAAAVRVPLLALFDAPDFLEAPDFDAAFLAPPAFDADFFAPPAFDADFFAPPRAELFAALLPADFDADLPALFDAPPLLDFDVVAFAITTSLGEPHARPGGHAHGQLGDDERVPQKLKSTK